MIISAYYKKYPRVFLFLATVISIFIEFDVQGSTLRLAP